MESIFFLILATLIAWVVEKTADAFLVWIIKKFQTNNSEN